MEIRFDGIQNAGGLRTVEGARFGMTRDGGRRPHSGIDLYARPGTPVLAITDGLIDRVRLGDPQYGQDILLKFRLGPAWLAHLARFGITDRDGVLYAQYAHLGSVAVATGASVRRGQVLGTTGTTGNADQRYPQLHFELRKIRSPGAGLAGLRNRINPELVFPRIDYSKPVEALDRLRRIA
jgi:murein DD-endopeptidase MepM/ murein hydrolase activator NlpD